MTMQDIFAYKQTGVDDKGMAQGYFHCTGIRPKCLERLEAAGIRLPFEMFERRMLQPSRGAV